MPDWTLVLPNNTTLGLTESNDLAVVGITGAGMPPIKNVYTPYGLSDGALWQRASVQPRLVTVLIDAVGTSWVGLHNLRAKLVEAVNPHGATPITIQYSAGGSKPDLYLDCYYDSGLEGGITEGFAEKGLALRFLATDPYWQQGTSTTANLAHIQTVTDVSGVVWRKTNGTINNMDTGVGPSPDGYVYAITEPDGVIRVYGTFTEAGSTPLAVQGIAEWDGEAWANVVVPWNTLPDYVSGGVITSNAVFGASQIYLGAQYTDSSSFSYGIWSYNGTTWEWMGTTATVTAMAVSPSGILYAAFDSNVYYYDTGTSSWTSIGAGVAETQAAVIHVLVFSQNGTLYAGGDFITIDGVSALRIAQYTTAGSWVALGDGLNSDVRALAVGPNGILYAGGNFLQSGTASRTHVAAWNGGTWMALGDGLDSTVLGLHINNDGELVANGLFDATGSKSLPSRVAVWHDNRWLDMGMGYASAGAYPAIFGAHDGATGLYVGGMFSGTWTAAGTTSVTNAGTARAYPIITLAGPGVLYYVINWTTGQRLYFDLTLLDGEILTLDLRPGIKTITSSFRGNCLPFLVSGNLIDFHLAPGANDIGVWINHASATASISFTARYWSADGAVPTP